MAHEKRMTVGELRESLRHWSDDTELIFGDGDLSMKRTKDRGGGSERSLAQIEFNEDYRVDEM